MDENELFHLRNYLHALRQSFTDHNDKNYLANIDRLVAVTDSELFENVVTHVYQRKEYIFKKKHANKQPHYRIPRLAALKCTASELDARIQALNLPDDIAIYGIHIPHPGFWCEHDEVFDSKNEDVNTVRRPSSPVGSEQICKESQREERNMHSHISWKSLGIRFMRNVNRWSDEESSSEEEDEEALYVKKIKPHSVAAGSLCVGDRILAINRIMLDQQSLDAIVERPVESDQTPPSQPAPNLHHLAIEICKAWLNGSPDPSGPADEPPVTAERKRSQSSLQLVVARSDSGQRQRHHHHHHHSQKPQWNVLWSATIPADPSAAMNISIPSTGSANCRMKKVHRVQKSEENIVEVELIDFVKSEGGIGAFLRPLSKGLGAKVEKLAEGELAAIDGRLRVDDRILYINNVCVSLMRFKEILHVYRAIADRARTTEDIQRGINFRPIRFVVSRPATRVDSQPTEASQQKLVVPRKSMLQAAKDLAELAESPQRVAASSVPAASVVTLVAGSTPVSTFATSSLRTVSESVPPESAATNFIGETTTFTVPVAVSCTDAPATKLFSFPLASSSPPPAISSDIEETEGVTRDVSKPEGLVSPFIGSVTEDDVSKPDGLASPFIGSVVEDDLPEGENRVSSSVDSPVEDDVSEHEGLVSPFIGSVVEDDLSKGERQVSSPVGFTVGDDSSTGERQASSPVGSPVGDVGRSFSESDSSLPDTSTAREMASALVDDILGEYEACPDKGVDLLRTDVSEDPPIECLPLTPYQKSDLRRFWRSNFRDNVAIIVADYCLPPNKHSFGITVETVIGEDDRANIMEYRHYLLEVDENGPLATQTDLRPRDELLEVNGMIIYGRDSEIVKNTLTSASQSGYIVCARPQVNGPFADVTPFSVIEEENEEDISIDVTSPISAFEGTDEIYHINSAELSQTGADHIRTPEPTEEAVFPAVFAPAPAAPNQPARAPSPRVAAPNVVKTEVPAKSKPAPAAQQFPTEVSVPADKQRSVPVPPKPAAKPVKDDLPDVYDDELTLVVAKKKAELPGLQLGPPVDNSWGFPVTEITPGGPVWRAINTPAQSSVPPPNLQLGDEVVEIDGRRLKGVRMFTLRAILWDLLSVEGEISLKYRPTSPAERTAPTSDRAGDLPQQSNNQPQISRLDQNPFIRMQAAGNLGSQSSNSTNHLKGGAGFSAGLNSSTGR